MGKQVAQYLRLDPLAVPNHSGSAHLRLWVGRRERKSVKRKEVEPREDFFAEKRRGRLERREVRREEKRIGNKTKKRMSLRKKKR